VSRYRFIVAEKATYPVSLLCRVLGVSRASFSAWLQRGPPREHGPTSNCWGRSAGSTGPRAAPTAPHGSTLSGVKC
jgi:hypothetical protein